MRETDITVVSLSGIYEHEGFHRNREGLRFIDCTDIRGTNGYCDAGAEEVLRQRIDTEDDSLCTKASHGKTVPGVSFPLHFIDHGNYHYLSKLYTDRLTEPFRLVVFDHHTDMQEPAFGGLLSCGSWVKEVTETNPFVRGVTLVGCDGVHTDGTQPDKRTGAMSGSAAGTIVLPEQPDITPVPCVRLGAAVTQLPVYISIDKDVLSPSEVLTNWDQGSMTADELFAQLDDLVSHNRILGMDVCGDAAPDMEAGMLARAVEMNDAFNRRILDWYLQRHRGRFSVH